MNFEITSPARVFAGAGEFSRAAAEAAALGKVGVIVTGSRLRQSNLIARLADDAVAEGMTIAQAPPVDREPATDMIDSLAEFIKANNADVVIAVGGGSVMDSAKAAAVMATNQGPTEDYQLRKIEIANPSLAQVFVPTTAGTGSESTRVSVLTNDRLGVKRSISHPAMTPDVVILDPELAVSLPLYLTTTTALDAFAHSIESAVSRFATSFTRHTALAAIEELAQGVPASQRDLTDLDARLKCLTGSYLAGLSMQQGLGASHSLAPAICIDTGARHSEVVGALLPKAVRLNERLAPGTYDEVSQAMKCGDVAERLEELSVAGGFEGLKPFKLKSSDWPRIFEIMKRYAGHRQSNAVEVTDSYAEELFMMSVRG